MQFAPIGHLLYVFAAALGRLPFAWLQAMGRFFGQCAYRLNTRETHVARRNLQLIARDSAPEVIEQRLQALMASVGQGLWETLAIWTRPRAKVLALVAEVQGEAHLQQALAKGRGVILAVPHYGNWELLIEVMAARGPFSLVYRAPEKEAVAVFLERARRGENVTLVPAEATTMRPLLRALQQGQVVGITPDQQPKRGGGDFIAFYGLPALTMSLIPKLAQRTGAAVLFAYTERMPAGFRVVFEAETTALHNPDTLAAMTAMNSHIQAIAERDFRQYQWTYKRFSIRPDPSEPKPYR